MKDGQVELSGAVGSLAEKNRARYEAWEHGVKSVQLYKLDVLSSLESDDLRAAKYVDLEDEQIEAAINAAHLHDPRVWAFKIQVDVDVGVATLRGTADSWSEWRSARENAYAGGAVIDRNELDVTAEQEEESEQDEQQHGRCTRSKSPVIA